MNADLKKKLIALIDLIDNLSWDYDRMSYSGQQTLDQIFELIDEIETKEIKE